MLNSKVIQTIKINTHFGPIEIFTGARLKNILERLAIEIFDDADHYINPSVALGLLYDTKLVSANEMNVLHQKFYYGRNLEEIYRANFEFYLTFQEDFTSEKAFIDWLESNLNRGLDRLRFYKDLLEAKYISYEDLSMSQFDRAAEHFIPYPTALELMARVSDVEFAKAIRTSYRIRLETTHNDNGSLRGISTENMRILEIICNFIGVTNAARYKPIDKDLGIAIYRSDRSSKENLDRLRKIVERVFDCKVEITDIRDMEYEEYDIFYNQFSRTMFTIVS